MCSRPRRAQIRRSAAPNVVLTLMLRASRATNGGRPGDGHRQRWPSDGVRSCVIEKPAPGRIHSDVVAGRRTIRVKDPTREVAPTVDELRTPFMRGMPAQ